MSTNNANPLFQVTFVAVAAVASYKRYYFVLQRSRIHIPGQAT